MRALGFAFGLPNTLLGIALALAGRTAGARLRWRGSILEVVGNPLLFRGTAICLGHVVCYGPGVGPGTRLAGRHTFAEHERQHVVQSAALGPLYLPLHFVFGLRALLRDGHWHGPSNRLEAGPLSSPPRPWG